MSKIYIVGSINMDLIINTDVVPEAGMTVTGYGFMTNPGGKGANQAVAVAKCGGASRMVGAVGNAFGVQLMDTLKDYGVDISHVHRFDEVSSGIAVITVNHGENRIILDTGANGLVSAAMAESALADAECGDWLIVQLEIPVETVMAALQIARSKNMHTILNPAPACELPDDIWQLADYFIPNQTETCFYTDIYPDTVEKAQQAAAILMEKGVGQVIITMGSQGALSVSADQTVAAQACRVEAIDTTAAGDTFVGALATRLSEGADIREAMTFANKASAVTVTRRGAQQAIPMRKEIM